MEGELHGLFYGTVTDNADPLKLGRVRFTIPGVVEQSDWAWPRDTIGGGSAGAGFYAVPAIHADVYVKFMMGDVDWPTYTAGHWGTNEAPSYIAPLSAEEAPNVRCFETPNFLLVFDDRSGNEKIIIKEKGSNTPIVVKASRIELGDSPSEPFIRGNDWKTTMEAILDALVAHNHPTAVGPSGPPINAALFTAEKAALSAKLSTLIFGK